MQSQSFKIGFVLLIACILLLATAPNEADAFRKPPLNGSIFGKRADVEGASRTLAAMCEIASEACSGWFPGSSIGDNK